MITSFAYLISADFVIADTDDRHLDFYGSARVHLDLVKVDEAVAGEDKDYVGARDAYSRVGVRGSTAISNVDVVGTLELGINIADFELGDPSFFDDQNIRVASVKLNSDFGTLTIGKDWLPFYNAVAAPVDLFSSVYAGFSTYAFFRENQLAFSSSYRNLNYTVAAISRTGSDDRGWQATASYPISNWTLAVGGEFMEGDISDTAGASAIWERNNLYLAVKYEYNSTDGNIYNWHGQYQLKKTLLKAGVGLGDQFGGNSWQLGVDYQLLPSLMLFAEIYAEDLNYAILIEGAERADQYLGEGGFGARQNGKALAIGAKFDF